MRHLNPRLPGLWTGGDYNPEQWPRSTWAEDARLMERAHFQVATIGMFAWARIEPEEGEYDFDWVEEVLSHLTHAGRWFILGTPSAAPPAWLSKRYPETLRTGPDGVRRRHGNRVNYNVCSEIYREKTREINRRLALRFGHHPRLLAWHLSNEYTGEPDYSPATVELFREWLQVKFAGDLDALNQAYWTAFWSHTYGSWDEIEAPGEPHGEQAIQGLTLDWQRFTTSQVIDLMLNEAAPFREISPEVPITTNLMATHRGIDYRKLAKHIDFISWDSYPANEGHLEDPETWATTAFKHDLMRSLKPDRPWLLMEYTPSTANWYQFMELKRPGTHRFETFHVIAHGADGAMMFQWRQSRGGPEQLHGGVVGHAGDENTRVFHEVREANLELEKLGHVAGSLVHAEAAVVFDWETRWALDAACGPTRQDKRYEETVIEHYRALWAEGISVDVVGLDDDLDRYRLLVAPMIFSLRPGFAERIARFVRGGGTFVTTYLSAWADENGSIFEGGFLSPLRQVLGIWSEELDALRPDRSNSVEMIQGGGLGLGGRYPVRDFCELVHPCGAEVIGTFGDDFYAGRAAVTRNEFGEGRAYYVASRNDRAFTGAFLRGVAGEAGIRPAVAVDLPPGVTAHVRVGADKEYVFLLNAGENSCEVGTRAWGEVRLGARDAVVLERDRVVSTSSAPWAGREEA